MGYDISIEDPVTRTTLMVEDGSKIQMHGGTYAVGGISELWLSETYNYEPFFRKVFGECGIYELSGMMAADAIPLIETAITMLGNDVDNDYWKPTEGNAKRALCRVLALCKMRPDGIVSID